jgi:hypothetical protein
MATRKWAGAWVSRGNVLTTELDALADNGYSAAGTEIDNSTNLDEFGMVEVNLASLNPTTGAYITLFIVAAPDGTNYENLPSTTNPGGQNVVAVMHLATGAAAKRVMSRPFKLPPSKLKFILRNDANVVLAATTNTMKLYTNNLASN